MTGAYLSANDTRGGEAARHGGDTCCFGGDERGGEARFGGDFPVFFARLFDMGQREEVVEKKYGLAVVEV